MEKFFVVAFVKNNLDGPLISSWIVFLKSIITHTKIPNATIFKGHALYLMVLLLNPLAKLHKTIQSETDELDDVIESFLNGIEASLNTVVELMPVGFTYKTLCVPIATVLIDALELYSEILVNDRRNYLQLFNSLLAQEVSSNETVIKPNCATFYSSQNNPLHMMTLKCLSNLCSNENIREKLLEFVFEERTNEDDDHYSFMKILKELMSRKGLKIEVISFLISLNGICGDRELLNKQMREGIYMNVFSASKKLVTKTVELMFACEENVWLQVINLLNSQITEEVDLMLLIDMLKSIEGVNCKLQHIMKILIDNIDTPATSQRAATIFVAMLREFEEDKHDAIIDTVDSMLEKCLADETTFVLILETLSIFHREKLANCSTIKFMSIVHSLIVGFEAFKTPKSLYNIVCALKKLSPISPEYVLKQVRELFQKMYGNFLNVFGEGVNDQTSDEPLTKLSLLLENQSWNILRTSNMEVIYRWNIKELSHEANPMLKLIIRMHTNLLKHFWARLLVDAPLPMIDVDQLTQQTKEFMEMLGDLVDVESNKPIQDYYLVFCSFLDLMALFQPSMQATSQHPLFDMLTMPLSKEVVKELAGLVEKFLFLDEEKNSNSNVMYQREMMLMSWIAFNKNYTKFPSSTASEKIIFYYRLKMPFKTQVELLMETLLTQRNFFEQTVAFAVLRMSNRLELTAFRSFHQALEDFMWRKFKGDVKKRLSVTSTICSFILSKLKIHVNVCEREEAEDRLEVLDCIIIMTKNMEGAMKQKLSDFIPRDLETGTLTDREKEHLKDFIALLRG